MSKIMPAATAVLPKLSNAVVHAQPAQDAELIRRTNKDEELAKRMHVHHGG